MTRYNNNRATPGNKANLRPLLQQQYLRQYYNSFNNSQIFENINNGDQITEGNLCQCSPFTFNKTKQGYNDPSQTANMRITAYLSGVLGGKPTFGNYNTPNTLSYLGGWEGQPGGSLKPLRNKF